MFAQVFQNRIYRSRSLTHLKVIGRILTVAAIVSLVGCGGPGSTPVPPPSISIADLIRNDLKMIADSGQVGSEVSSIQDNLTKYREENPAVASQLLTELEKLQGLSGAEAKSVANEMIAKLK